MVAAVVAYVTYGYASEWAASWAYAGTAANTVGNAVAAGAMAGAVGGASAGYLNTGSLTGALRGVFTGTIAGGYANFGSVSGWGDAARRVGIAALGGCGAGKASGGSCGKGARMAAMMQALSVGMEMVSKSKPTWDTAEGVGVENPSVSNVGKPIEVIKGKGADHLVGRSLSSLTAEEAQLLLSNNPFNQGKIMLDGEHVNFSWDSEGSSAFTRVANTTPGMNSMVVFHDVWMAKWNVNSAFVLGATIVRAV
ncbi:hypothetical protein ACSSVW_000172 [Pseudoalteromonas sp. MBR-15]